MNSAYSLQRRSDLVAINIKEQINFQEKTIRILQQKSENYDKPVFIDIAMGDELYQSVMDAGSSEVPCPYLVHCRPRRITKVSREAHYTEGHEKAVPVRVDAGLSLNKVDLTAVNWETDL